jgi:hypothetical protein
MPNSNSYTTSINFDTSTIKDAWTDMASSYIAVPLTITPTTTMVKSPVWPNIAFKSSALSVFNRIVVRTSKGQVLVDEVNTGAFADHLRLCFERDQDWLKLVAPAIHYARDRAKDGVVGLHTNALLTNPSIAKYAGAPAVASAGANNNFDNPAYNEGYHERNIHLMRSCYTSTGVLPAEVSAGTSMSCNLNIPLSCIHDFFKQLSFPITGLVLYFEFYLTPASEPFSPFTVGSVLPNQTQEVGGAIKMAVAPNTVLSTPRLYYHSVVLQPEQSALMSKRLAEGFRKSINWRRYEIMKEVAELKGVANATQRTLMVSSSANAPRRMWLMTYPKDQINSTSHPSVLATSANGFSSLQVLANGKPIYVNPLMTNEEQYAELRQAMHLGRGGEAEALLPYQDFRLVSRIHCLDLTRACGRMADPNAPVSLQLQYTTQTQGDVDIVILLETEVSATLDFTAGQLQVSVAPALWM